MPDWYVNGKSRTICEGRSGRSFNNARFIAASRTALPACLEALEMAVEALEKIKCIGPRGGSNIEYCTAHYALARAAKLLKETK
jgi:hypothetical protein